MSNESLYLNELFRIVSGALRLDVDKVRNYTAYLADKLETAGDGSTASRLRKLLEESDRTLRPAGATSAALPPVDSESRFPLLERVNLRRAESGELVLRPEEWGLVHEFLSVAKSHAQLEAAGIQSSPSLLLFGAPGVGKSRLARHIARELGLDLYVARLDGVVSSYLGSTSKNIRAVFEFAGRTPCVLFLDEFDAIAKLRGDGQELGELKRVVNSFLQNLDALGTSTVVIAATNHEELLDRAVWRRFAYRLRLRLPNRQSREKLWVQLLAGLEFDEKDAALLADLSEGFSGSDITEVALRLRRMKITGSAEPDLSAAFRALRNLASGGGSPNPRFVTALLGKSEEAVADMLRAKDSRLYSHATIARLLGVSKSTAYRLASTQRVPDERH